MPNSFFRNMLPLTRKKASEGDHLLGLANEARLNFARAMDPNLPLQVRYEKFILARQQALEVVDHG